MSQNLAIYGGTKIRDAIDPRVSPIGLRERKAVNSVLDSGLLSAFRGGPRVLEFEEKFAHYCGCRYAMTTTSGTTALHAALSACELNPGDEVVVPALTFVSTASVVLQENATPVFADIDDTYCMDPEDLERKITKKTKAIIVVHLYGHPANMPAILAIARKHKLRVIEDCAQAHGASIHDLKVGAFGDFGCFSFFQTKNMTCGEGGMVTTNNERLYEKCRLRREHGSPRTAGNSWYNYEVLGFNYNMTEIQAAIGIVQLSRLPQLNRKRVANAQHYRRLLSSLPLSLPPVHAGYSNVYHNFPVLLPGALAAKRDLIVEAIRAEGVWADVCYPLPLYRTELFARRGISGDCPRSETFASSIITLFTDPQIQPDYLRDTCLALHKCISYFLARQ